MDEGDFAGGFDGVDIATELVATECATLHGSLRGRSTQVNRACELGRSSPEQRNSFDSDENEDPDDAQDDRNSPERDDAHRRTVDALESFDAARSRRHLPAHG